ncbi:MAG: zinc-ribbon domain-containing protein [Desulfobacterales bacterium]|nr:zinc-ribbon domain-containing protein [Desulfobacterales bacterium]
MEKATESEGGSGMGMGTGLGLMMPAMFAQYFASAQPGQNQNAPESKCPECHNSIPAHSKFCPDCGHQLLVFEQCTQCSKNLTPTAKFCSRCGQAVAEAPEKKFCPNCGNENMADADFCNECGEKLGGAH